MKKRDSDAVWLGILQRATSGKTPAQVHRLLTAGGFPQRIVKEHLAGARAYALTVTGTPAAILARLRGMVAADGNQACVARRLGVTPQYLSAVLAGKKGVGDQIPRALGYTEVVRYEATQ